MFKLAEPMIFGTVDAFIIGYKPVIRSKAANLIFFIRRFDMCYWERVSLYRACRIHRKPGGVYHYDFYIGLCD